MRATSVAAVRSSLALISRARYPQCRATTCASVVFPSPAGGAAAFTPWGQHHQTTAEVLQSHIAAFDPR